MARSRKSSRKSSSPKKSRRSRRSRSASGSRKRRLSPGAKKWLSHVMATKRAGGANMTLKQAMKKASKSWKGM
jgi:hypothetical protein